MQELTLENTHFFKVTGDRIKLANVMVVWETGREEEIRRRGIFLVARAACLNLLNLEMMAFCKTERLCVGVNRMSRMSQRLIPKL